MNILLFGPPGAGKGTQSSFLKERLGMVHISTGDLFRSAIKKGTELGREAQGYLDAGKLVPDALTIRLIEEVLSGLKGSSFILDGFPRTIPQADALEVQLKKTGLALGKSIFLDVPTEMLLERLTGRRVCEKCGESYHVVAHPPKVDGVCDKCGGRLYQRKDDSKEAIGVRLKAYEDNTAPLRAYYRGTGQYVEVLGTGTSEQVYERIQRVVN